MLSSSSSATPQQQQPKSEKESILAQWSLTGRNYVVTGGAKGIGYATVQALLTHGAAMVLFCSRSPCDDIVTTLQTQYPQATIGHVACDVSTAEGRDALVAFVQTQLGGDNPLHGLVNNVGLNVRKPMTEQTEAKMSSGSSDSRRRTSENCASVVI